MLEIEVERPFHGTSPIHVQIFEGRGKSRMTRNAALHLYRLLQRYSWCLAVNDYVPRWVEFWPGLTSIERALLVYTVKTHCGGEFGRRLSVSNLPADFEQFEGDTRALPINSLVEREFLMLLEEHGEAVGGNREIRRWISQTCSAAYQTLEALHGLDKVFGANSWICPHKARSQCHAIYLAAGRTVEAADKASAAIEKALFGFYENCGAIAA
ncbi:hypothetical protein [Agrobacterium tumefaciens]|uniref:hypothetical protein n=1 Tax=Agrobacterium tumefaciens TaxID=358 RepID=UPI0015717F99|nr:hypothetical protein [Agrobacterium tumefaciens]NTB05905.1 hypothetical protein [Agrobacterium tumefaciens]